MPEPTQDQAKAAEALSAATVLAKTAAIAFMRDMQGLRDAVALAHAAGIPRQEVYRNVAEASNGYIPPDVKASLRKTLRQRYKT
jgi:hypothetical protein